MLDVVIPVYNEGENVQNLFEQIKKDIKTQIRIIIVYDFDEDNTVSAVRKFEKEYDFQVQLVKNIFGRGALNAIKTGLSKAKEAAVLVMMADLSDDLRIVDTMYAHIQDGCDVVCGSRYMKGGKQIGGPLLKKLISRTAGVSLHYLIGIPTHDITNSFKMYSRRVIDTIQIESTGGFELGMELTVKSYLYDYKIMEIPSVWYDRVAGKSNFNMWGWMPRYLHWYFFAIKNKYFRKKKKRVW